MITLTERNRIAKAVLTTENEAAIRKIESIIFSTQPVRSGKRAKNEKPSLLDWDSVPDEVKKGIEKSLKQAEAGQTIPHEEVMKKYKKWLKK